MGLGYMTKNKFYIIPGWGERLTDKNYRQLIRAVSPKYEVVPLRVQTRNRKYSLGSEASFFGVAKKISDQMPVSTDRDVLLGFSIGALLAYQIARYRKFKNIILCSLPPLFGNDIFQFSKKEISDLALGQQKEMSKLKYFPLLTKNVTIFWGEKEAEAVQLRGRQLALRKGWKSFIVKKAGHKLGGEYLDKLLEFVVEWAK